MPKKNTLKSRKNKRQFSLKKATRKRGGGILNSVFSKKQIYQSTKPKRDEVIPPVLHNLKTFNDLQTLFNGNIPLDIFTIDMDKIQEYKRQEENSPAPGREELYETPDAAKQFADHSPTWNPTNQPPPLPPQLPPRPPPLPPRPTKPEPEAEAEPESEFELEPATD